MKKFIALILFALTINSTTSQAFIYCKSGVFGDSCPNDPFYWIMSTGFTGPLGIIFDGEIDLTKPTVRNVVLAQTQLILDGNRDAINPSENIVALLAQAYNVDMSRMALAIKNINDSKNELNKENISQSLNQ